jgi:hypothetical protein
MNSHLVLITITLRDEPLPSDTTVLLQFGNGGRRSAAQLSNQIAKRHDYWFGVIDQHGRFAVSVYALIGIPEERVSREMHHRMYGRTTVGHVRDAGFEIRGSTVEFDGILRSTWELQPFHQSIFLPISGSETRLLSNKTLLTEFENLVRPHVETLLQLFEPSVLTLHPLNL